MIGLSETNESLGLPRFSVQGNQIPLHAMLIRLSYIRFSDRPGHGSAERGDVTSEFPGPPVELVELPDHEVAKAWQEVHH